MYPEPKLEFILSTNASMSGRVLSQLRDGQEKVVAYASRVLKKAEQSYCVTCRKLLAVVTFLRQFRPYILWTTNHNKD